MVKYVTICQTVLVKHIIEVIGIIGNIFMSVVENAKYASSAKAASAGKCL